MQGNLSGIPKGAQLPLEHDFALAKSSVLCLSSDWREKLRRRRMGGAVLSDRKTGREFRADSEEIALRFRRGGRAYSSRPSSIAVDHVDHLGDVSRFVPYKCHLSHVRFVNIKSKLSVVYAVKYY